MSEALFDHWQQKVTLDSQGCYQGPWGVIRIRNTSPMVALTQYYRTLGISHNYGCIKMKLRGVKETRLHLVILSGFYVHVNENQETYTRSHDTSLGERDFGLPWDEFDLM